MPSSLILALVVGSISGAAPAASRSVAIEPLKSLGSDQEIVNRLEAILRQETSRLRGVSYKECQVAADRCGDDVGCLARRGGECGVEKMVFGTVATLGQSYVLDLKLIDVKTRREERRHTQTLAGDQAVLIEGVRVAATRLIVPEQYLGSLEVRFERAGARVFVDGVKHGITPIGIIGNLPPGPHELRIELSGAQDFTRPVEVFFGRTTLVNLSLRGTILDAKIETATVVSEPSTQPAAPIRRGPSLFMTSGIATAAVGGVVLAAGLAAFGLFTANYLAMDDMLVYRDGGNAGPRDPAPDKAADYKNLYDQNYVAWNLAIPLSAVGAVVALAGVGLITWDLVRPRDE